MSERYYVVEYKIDSDSQSELVPYDDAIEGKDTLYETSCLSIEQVKSGFWVDQYGQFATGFGCYQYIFPHQIISILTP